MKDKTPNPYKIDRLSSIPPLVKVIFLKWWMAGAVCFFIAWGIPGISASDMLLVLGIVLGMATDLLLCNLFRFMETDKKEYNKYMLFPQRKFWTIFPHVIIGIGLALLIANTYQWVNLLIHAVSDTDPDMVPFGVEPITFGLFYLAYDFVLLGLKALLKRLFTARKKPDDITTES